MDVTVSAVCHTQGKVTESRPAYFPRARTIFQVSSEREESFRLVARCLTSLTKKASKPVHWQALFLLSPVRSRLVEYIEPLNLDSHARYI